MTVSGFSDYRSLKCRFCRALFKRPPHLGAWVPAIACERVECQQKRAERERKFGEAA